MKGIRLLNGTIFIKDDLLTYKKTTDGKWTPSPVLFDTLEWELPQNGPMDEYEYLNDDDISALPDFSSLQELSQKIKTLLKI